MQMLSHRYINKATGQSRFTAIPYSSIILITWNTGKELYVYIRDQNHPLILEFDNSDKANYVYNKLTENGIQC